MFIVKHDLLVLGNTSWGLVFILWAESLWNIKIFSLVTCIFFLHVVDVSNNLNPCCSKNSCYIYRLQRQSLAHSSLEYVLLHYTSEHCFFTDEFDAYIIVSFVNATLVLSIGETVEEVTDSGFLGTTPTLSCSQLGDDALVQVNIDHFKPSNSF